jgi:hypothetical protein
LSWCNCWLRSLVSPLEMRKGCCDGM